MPFQKSDIDRSTQCRIADFVQNGSVRTYSRNTLYGIKQHLECDRRYLHFPVTAWQNLRTFNLNSRKTRCGNRSGSRRVSSGQFVCKDNLVSTKRVKDRPLQLSDKNLKICTVNIRSIINKHLIYFEHLIDEDIDVCFVMEVCLNNLEPTVTADLNDFLYSTKRNDEIAER